MQARREAPPISVPLRFGQLVNHPRKRHEHKPDSDRDPTGIADAVVVKPAEGENAGENKRRRDQPGVERQYLRNQSGTDVCAKHHRQSRAKTHKAINRECRCHKACGCAALQQCGQTHTGKKRTPALMEVMFQPYTESGAKPALHPGGDHAGAP